MITAFCMYKWGMTFPRFIVAFFEVVVEIYVIAMFHNQLIVY